MTTLTFVSDLKLGDVLDLRDDTWADVPISMTEPSRFAGDYAVILGIAPTVDDFIAVTIDCGAGPTEVVDFPDDHQVRKVNR